MSPAPEAGFGPRWLHLLQRECWTADDPSYQEIAERAGLRVETVSSIFEGVTPRPRQSTLAKIFAALNVSDEKAREIRIALYAPALQEQPAAQTFEPLDFRTDAQILAAAINNLADAVRGLSLLDRQQER